MSEKRVPWGEVLQDHSPSSIAPGRPDDGPNAFPTVKGKKTGKRARKLAQKLEEMSTTFQREVPAAVDDWGQPDADTSSEWQEDGAGVSASQESSPVSAGDGEDGHRSPNALGAKEVQAKDRSQSQGTTSAFAKTSEDDDWNPMKADYENAAFNSYTKGPGKLLKPSPVSKEKNCVLYVAHVPVQLTRDGLVNLFSRAGKVKRATVMKPRDSSRTTTYGLVEFGTVREADRAFQILQNFDMGDRIRLRIKVYENKEERDKRRGKAQEERDLLKSMASDYESEEEFEMDDAECANPNPFVPVINPTPHLVATEVSTATAGATNPTPSGHESEDEFEMDDAECTDPNPFVPVINPTPHSVATEVSTATVPSKATLPALDSKSSSKGRSAEWNNGASTSFKLDLTPKQLTSSLPTQLKPPSSFSVSSSAYSLPSSAPSSCPPCTYCSAPSTKKCSVCKAPYCSPGCQEKDWPKHKLACRKEESSLGSPSRPQVKEEEKVLSDDDELDVGFTSDKLNELFCKAPNMEPVLTTPPVRERSPSRPGSGLRADAAANGAKVVPALVAKGDLPRPPSLSLLGAMSSSAAMSEVVPDDEVKADPLISLAIGSLDKEGSRADSQEFAILDENLTQPSLGGGSITYAELLAAFSLPEAGEPPSLPPSETLVGDFQAFPTLIVSSTQLSILPFFSEIKARLETLVRYGKSEEVAKCPKVKKIERHVAYGFIDDRRQFFRVELPLAGTEFSCVDTGCTVAVSSKQQLFALPGNIRDIPPLRCRGSMRDLIALTHHTAQRTDGRNYLIQLVSGKVILCKNSNMVHNPSSGVDILVMDVFLPGSVVSVGELVHRQGYASLRQPKSLRAAPPPLLATPSGPTHYARLVPFHDPPSHDVFEIYPTVVVSPAVIYAQVLHPYSANLKWLIQDLTRASLGAADVKYVPSVGEICATQFDEDRLFYRAEVVQVNNNATLDVHFVDYGNRATVRLSEVRRIDAPFLELPQQALQFAVAGISPPTAGNPYSKEACTFLTELIFQKRVAVKIVSGSKGSYAVDMFHPDNSGALLSNVLIERGYAKSAFLMKGVAGGLTPPITVGRGSAFDLLVSQPAKPGLAAVPPSLKAEALPGDTTSRWPAAMTSTAGKASKPSLLGDPISRGNKPIAAGGNKRGRNQSNQGSPKSKASVKSPESSGNRPWPAKVCDRASPSTPSRLNATSLLGSPTKSVSKSPASPSGKPRYFKGRQPSSGAKSPGGSVTSESGHAKQPLKTEVVDASPRSQICSPQRGVQLPVATLPVEHKVEVVVTDITNSTSFHVVKADAEVVRELARISDELQKEDLVPLSPVAEGLPCIAKDTDDVVYRARVVSLRQSSSSVLIKFVDYGNTVEVKEGCVFKMDTRHRVLPAQAIHCCLAHSGRALSSQAQELFLSTAREARCTLLKTGEEGNKSCVKLWINRDGADVNLLDVLLEFSLKCKPDDCQASSSSSHAHSPVSVARIATPTTKFDDLQAFPLPDADPISALVTEVLSPGAIYVQVDSEDSIRTLTSLSETIDKHFRGNTPICVDGVPEVGDVYCAKYAQDGLWYRVQVLCSPGDKGCSVQFIDYGNSECVPRRDLAYCPASILSVPVMAVRCSLGGIMPRGAGYNSRAIEFLKRYVNGFVKLKVLGRKLSTAGKKLVVRMKDSATLADLAEELLKHELVLPARSVTPSSPSMSSTVSLDKSPTKSPASSDGTVKPTAVQPAKVPLVDFAGGGKIFYDVLVSDIASASSIQVQVVAVDTQRKLQELQSQLSVYASNVGGKKPASFSPSVGSHCCAVLPKESAWYRAEVLSVSGDDLCVRYLDFGDRCTVPGDSVLPLTAELAKMPAVAYEVALAGIVPKKKGVVKELEKLLSDRLLSMQIKDAQSKPMKVKLLDLSCSKDAATELMRVGLAKPLPEQPEGETRPLPLLLGNSPQKPVMFESLPPLDLAVAPRSQVMVVHVESLSRFYVQLARDGNCQQILSLAQEIRSYVATAPAMSRPLLDGELCVAKFAGEFYRAKVIKTRTSGLYSLLFVDYGNCSDVAVNDIRPMAEGLAKFPAQGVACALVGIPFNYPPSVIEEFKKVVDGKVLFCRAFSTNPLVIDLEIPHSPASVRTSFSQNRLLPPLKDSGQFAIEHAAFPTSGMCLLLVHDAASPRDFWMQVHNASALNDLKDLSDELQTTASRGVALASPLLLGQLCVAKFHQDNQWYRAQIVELLGVDRATVRFLDYGNVASVSANELRLMLPQHTALPSQAINGSLHGFTADSGPKNATARFRSLTDNTILQGSLRGHVFPDRVVVELTMWDGANLCTKLFEGSGSKVRPSS